MTVSEVNQWGEPLRAVFDFEFAKMFKNVLNRASGLISFEFSDAFVVGTFRIAFEKSASGWLSVVRYLRSSYRSGVWSVTS